MKELIACEKNEDCLFENVMIACLDALKQRAAGEKASVLNILSEYLLLCNLYLEK